MDLITNRTKEIGAMALDGLYERAKAISSNTANALTPNYKRKEVSFEASLRNVIERENEKENIKLQNSALFAQGKTLNNDIQKTLLSKSPEQIALLNSDILNTDIKEGYTISIDDDPQDAYSVDGNNVSIESEMMDEAKTGMQYQVVANLLAKSYQGLRSVIQGQNGQ